ncbi:MAG: hypothetical protein H6927_12610 [Burkholderiaceae bacterium]|nr:hypothetical protein [Burkholderiaceae bacterium]MCP5218937.1 hypothetical protein [Burkholderiaceae bacterium]
MTLFSFSPRWARALGGAVLALASLGAAAQTRYTLSGTDYELVAWPSAATGTDSISSDPWSSEFGAGTIAVGSPGGLESAPSTVGDFYSAPVYANAGYGITGTPLFRVNNGQSEPDGSDIVTTYTVTAAQLPKELMLYVGGEALGTANSGLKYVRWAWASAQPGTRFEVLAHTPSLTVSGSGSPALSWRTFGSDNNVAMALVRITNPAGIGNFSVTSNRLDTDGSERVYTNTNQRADYNGIAILVPRPAAVSVAQAVPTLGMGGLALLLAALGGAAAWAMRRQPTSWSRSR